MTDHYLRLADATQAAELLVLNVLGWGLVIGVLVTIGYQTWKLAGENKSHRGA